MIHLSALENMDKRVNITQLAIPEMSDRVTNWRPEMIITPELWKNVCDEITTKISKQEYQKAAAMAGYLAILFPERKHEIPFSERQYESGVVRFLELMESKKESRLTILARLQNYLIFCRQFWPDRVDGLLKLNPEFTESLKSSILRHIATGSPSTAYDDAKTFIKLTGTTYDVSSFEKNPGRIILEDLIERNWWDTPTEIEEFLDCIEDAWMFFPELTPTLKPPALAIPPIIGLIHKKRDLMNVLMMAYSVSLSVAEQVWFTREGVKIAYADDKVETPTVDAPPVQRNF